MTNIFLLLSLVFFFTFFVGKLLEKIRIPWIFAALLLGAILAIHNPFDYITTAPTFNFLSNLGMYFLLFVIGFEINLKQIKEKSTFIFKSVFFIISLEAILGCLAIHFIFEYSWFVSLLVALSFATVGEAILIPILHEFKIINTRLGQTIISIGTLDDIIEILILILVIIFAGTGVYGYFNIGIIIFFLFCLFILTFGLSRLKSQGEKFNVLKVETLFLFTIAILFLFLGIGEYASSTALGAILAGIGLKTFIPDERLNVIENEIKAVCYGLFAPIFFLWAGISMDIKYLAAYPLLVLLIIIISSGSKYLGAYIIGRKELGLKQSILLGTGLSVRFSASIVIIKILSENKVIENNLYSVIIASSIIFTFVIPIIFSQLLRFFKAETAGTN